MSFHPLEHKLINAFKNSYGNEKKDYWLSCSGGVDSVALLYVLKNIQPIFNYNLSVLYIHHGSSHSDENYSEKNPSNKSSSDENYSEKNSSDENYSEKNPSNKSSSDENYSHKKQSIYRDEALECVGEICKEHVISFKSFKSSEYLKSEEECRDFRINIYKKLISNQARVFLAHHRDDFFETLLIRLIRGTGPNGFKDPFAKNLERPFLNVCGRNELKEYQRHCGFKFLEDPSNDDQNHLRNWLRQSWLPQLEKSPHGLKPFKNSLIQLSECMSQAESDFDKLLFFNQKDAGYFELKDFMNFNQVQKKAFISNVLHKLKKSGYTAGQALEVLKLLEHKNQRMNFTVSGIGWKKTGTKVYFNNFNKA